MKDFTTAAPAVLTLLTIPLTFSIAEGIAIGLICWAVLALALGRPQRMTAMGYLVATAFFLQLFRIWPFAA